MHKRNGAAAILVLGVLFAYPCRAEEAKPDAGPA